MRLKILAVGVSSSSAASSCNVLGQSLVIFSAWTVQNQKEHVKSRQKSSWKIDIFVWRHLGVVSSVKRVSSCQNRCPGVQGGGDSSLGDRNRLLLHHFVNSSPVRLLHLVELINTADTIVGQHQGTSFQNHLVGDWVSHHGCSQSDSRRTFTGSVHTSWSDGRDGLEQLRLGDSGISHQQHVDITSNSHSVAHLLWRSPNKKQQESFLDVCMAKDFWSNRVGESLICLCQQSGSQSTETSVWGRQENSGNINNVSWVHRPHKVSVNVDGKCSWNMTDRNLVCKFLDLDVLESRELRGSGTWEQFSAMLVAHTSFGSALSQRSKGSGVDFLENLKSTRITSICGDFHGWLDIAHSGDDSSHSDQLSQAGAFHVSHGEGFSSLCAHGKWSEVDEVPSGQLGWKQVWSLNISQVLGVLAQLGLGKLLTVLVFDSRISEFSLVDNHIQHVVFMGDVNCRVRHDFVHNLREQLDIVVGIVDN
ncbi:hypothetical protein OGAPHI_004833 [Ogataea philodendri]|uniref:Uncharacterized protein n=1 Tax=Ogataea philodendri TaxID=1378263 RepID=A0A9P8P308_9ASCO|nr:uncharacterized protein OGAPHI_004833 [Ogataea philodendri]KAH3664119.1 hypothetical protein OGAPHI_004833 [Ogataea philodendri]